MSNKEEKYSNNSGYSINKNNKSFYDKKIYIISNYIWCFFFGNFYFIITSILFLITMIAYGSLILSEGFLYMYISSLTLGPSLGAVTGLMYKLIKEKEVSVSSDYFKSYKNNFKQSFFLWAIIDTFIFYILFDIKLFSFIGTNKYMLLIFYILMIIAITIASYGFMIIVKFDMNIWNILKLSFRLTLRKSKTTIYNILILGSTILLMNKFLFLWALCLFTIVSYLLVSNMKCVMDELEEKSIKQEKLY